MIELTLKEQLEKLLDLDPTLIGAIARSLFEASTSPRKERFVLFGAGNLGKKALRALRAHEIEPLAFCDNGSRLWGTTVEGLPVLSPADAAKQYGTSAAFIITVFSPACNVVPMERQLRDLGCSTVISFVPLLWKYAEMCCPHVMIDLPERILAHRNKILAAFSLFHDETSQREFVAQIEWKLASNFSKLPAPSPDAQYFPRDILELTADDTFIDGGAYTGDTVQSVLEQCPEVRKIVALEPDPINFERLEKYVAGLPTDTRDRIKTEKIAVGDKHGTVCFESDGGLGAKIGDRGGIEVVCDTLDNRFAALNPTFIKLDVEGAEADAIRGAAEIMQRGNAIWAVCIYHKQNDLWELPLLLESRLPKGDYQFFIRKHGGEIFDTVCYAVPNGRVIAR